GLALGQTADPEVDVVEAADAGRRARARAGGRRQARAGRSPIVHAGGERAVEVAGGAVGALAVGADEVPERQRMLEREPELEPVRVRLHRGVVRLVEELDARVVQRRDAL